MGVGGKFWDLLKPYARQEGPDFLREKRVAIDLSYWIVQHETAVKSYVRKPHLRLTFFRTINLFSKFGAFPVFVVEGTPSHLKSRARISRFFRSSGIDTSDLPVPKYGVSVERNGLFLKWVQECMELLELFGMPVLKANGEAEALCAQLNREGCVDACITADSDAFMFGAKCVIKSIKPNSKEPFECYQMSDIEAGLGLKRKHLIAIALLVGNDHDLNGVQGVGVDTAFQFVQTFHEDEILNCLNEIGKGNYHGFLGVSRDAQYLMLDPLENLARSKTSHCSFCGHPGNKRAHFKSSCGYCGTNNSEGCTKKLEGFKCNCLSCNKDHKDKEKQKRENWQIKVCDKISKEQNFPNNDIVEMYLCNNHADFTEDYGTHLSWRSPNTDMLIDFLAFHKLWEPSYIRQRMLPMLSTIYLREMAAKPEKALLHGQYEFDSIQRVKIRYGHKSYVIKWKKSAHTVSSDICINIVEEYDKHEEDIVEIDESIDQLEESDVPHTCIDDGCWFLLTDENVDLINSAFPDAVDRFLKEKELKELKRRKCSVSSGKSDLVKSKGVQLNITEFYRSTKFHVTGGEKQADNSENQDDVLSKEKRKISTSNLPKLMLYRYGSKVTCNAIWHQQKQRVTLGNAGIFTDMSWTLIGNCVYGSLNEDKWQVLSVNTNQNAQGLVGVSIMVVDGDSVALAIVSKMLHTSGYKVITATRATDALRILRERQHELDLILTEVHLPDMDKYELLETMREISRLPIVILSGDNNENVMLGCLFKGAMFYFVKPITMNDIQNLWQFSRMKNQEENVVTEGSCSYQYHSLPDFRSNEASECRPVLYTCQLDAQKDKRKGVEQMYKDEEDSVSSNVPKKPKLIWTNELHNRFLQAIRILGVDSAHPKKILKHMNVPGLKKENISSHLQKYRLSLKREQDVIQKTMFKNSHFSPWNLEIGCSEVLETQFLMTRNQADLRGYVENQHNLNGLCMSTLPVCSAIFPPHVQSYLQNNQINTTHTSYSEAGMRIDRGKEQGSLNQTRNDNAEEFYQPKTAFSSTEDYGFEIATHDDVDILGNLAQQQEQCLMPPLSPLPLEVEPEISGPERVEVDELSDIASFSSELFRELANNDLL